MIRFRDKEGEWVAETASFRVPLRKGLAVRVEPGALRMLKERRLPGEAIRCRVVEWELGIEDAEHAALEIVVEEVRIPLIEWVLRTAEVRFYAGIVAGLITSVVVGANLYNFYLDHDYGWALLGRHAGGLGVAFLMLFLAVMYRWTRSRKWSSDFWSMYFFAVLFYTGVVLVLLWRSYARLPADFNGMERLHGTDGAYAEVGRALVEKLKPSRSPFLLAALPWVGLLFKTLGMEVWAKGSELLAETGKEKK